VLIALLAFAGAQEPSAPTDVSEEVVVYARLRVAEAREAVIQELQDLGYTKLIEKDGAIVLRHEDPWKGDVWLHDDGWMRIRRQPVRVEAPATPWGKRNSATAWMGCVLYPFACVRPGGQIVSTRKFMAVETRTAGAVEPDVAVWADRVADLAVDEKVGTLPDRLTALWEQGVPLDPGPPLEGVEARKLALLTYWESRTDTPWGEEVRAAVEAFVRSEVQHSDTPFTVDELDAFNARSRAGRPLVLDRRVADEEGLR
jgi:hypothetical protein